MTLRRTIAAAILPLLAGCHGSAGREPASAPLILSGVNVIDGHTGRVSSRNVDVVVEGDRITGIRRGGAERDPRGARVLDLPGRYVMPGLIDTHAHVTVLLLHDEPGGGRRSEYRRDLSEQALRTLLAHGVTTVRNPSAPAEAGVALRDDVARGRLIGPRILTSGEHLNDPRMTEDRLRAEVRRQASAGVDMIKVYAGLYPEQVAVVVDEAHRLNLRVVGHLQHTSWTEAARLRIDAITHGSPWSAAYLPPERRAEYGAIRDFMRARLFWLEAVDLDGPEVAEMIAELAEQRIPVDPTLIAYRTRFFGDDPRWTENPALTLVPELAAWWRKGNTFVSDWTPEDYARARGLWPKIEAMVVRYHAAGVLLTVGSDMPVPWTIPGVSMHEEMELLAQAGIPRDAVLRQATRNGAEALGLLHELGTVEVGKRADLLVLSDDPTTDIRNTRRIEAVIQGGVLLRPWELLGPARDAPARDTAPGPGGLRAASASVPWDSVERGIGVVAFGEPHRSGTPRVDTLHVRESPSPGAPLVALVVHDARGPGDWYTLLAAPGLRRNLSEIAYEELAVPFDSLAGGWARVIYGRAAGGPPLRGWLDTGRGEVRTLWWADLLQRHGLFLADPESARFRDGPDGAVLDTRLVAPGTFEQGYDLEPVAADGDWLQVRVRVPSICSGEAASSERIAWIRYLDVAGRPLVWPRTRGC